MSPRFPFASLAAVGVLAATILNCSEPTAPQAPTNDVAAAAQGRVTVTRQNSGTKERLQAISPVNDRVAWASGTGGTYSVTTDGGAHWRSARVPGAGGLEFRDVQAFSAKVAYLMSAGPGRASRIYKTVDGGQTWTLQFKNQDPSAFYDCFAFWDRNRGVTMSDAVNGVFPVIRTTNGKSWKNIGSHLPEAQAGEAAFAASGTCIATQGTQNAWIATGGAAKARIIATTDGGDTWNAYETPVVQGTPSSGGISVAFRDAQHGILGAGELAVTDKFRRNVARTLNGGKSWFLGNHPTFTGSIYGLAYVTGLGRTVVATGPQGASWTGDEGDTWKAIEGVNNCWAVAFASAAAGWLVGTEGQIIKLSFGN
jgi:photosystem II stability/assembly factor-like uncharacterized protein